MKPSPTDLNRSIDRVAEAEEHRARASGFGATKQGQALARKYLDVLADKIAADRARPNDRAVWRALKDLDCDDEMLALHVLIAGISVAEDNALGADKKNGLKNFRD